MKTWLKLAKSRACFLDGAPEKCYSDGVTWEVSQVLFISMTNTNRVTHAMRAIRKSPVEMGIVVVMTFILGYGLLPGIANADARTAAFPAVDVATSLKIAAMQNQLKDYGVLPEADLRGPSYTVTVPATAYNSLPNQTDDTPFITASGTHVRHGVLAANFLPIGTRVKIPDLYGDQVFIVEDRMNPRYYKRVDIWMEEYDDAIAFGVKNITIEVYN